MIVMDQVESASSIGRSVNHVDQMIDASNTPPEQQEAATMFIVGDEDSSEECNQPAQSCDFGQIKSKRPSVYETVIGTNDQELARRQYSDDDDCEDENCSPRLKKVAVPDSARAIKLEPSDHQDAVKNDATNRVADQNGLANGCESNGLSSTVLNPISADRNSPVVNSSNKSSHKDEPEQIRKLFIGGLDYKTSEETLKSHFEKFGQVIDCVVMREPQSKRSRGFGFVIYANSSMVDKAQEARPHEVDGREVQSKRAISREDSGKPEAQATVKKVYLGGLSDDIEESELREYFAEFGCIVNVNIVAHKDTGKRRGFAFVEYDDYDPVDKIVLKKYHTIKDRRIEAKKAIPKIEMDARKRIDPRVSMSGAMMTLSSPHLEATNGRTRGPSGRSAGACLWDSPFGGGYQGAYSAVLDGYPSHYHSPPSHYGAGSWVVHGSGAQNGGGGGGPYGFRGSHGSFYGRNGYASPTGGGWTSAVDYGAFPSQGGAGPMRLSYQHRSWAPYSNGYGSHRSSRGYNP